jgi:hypothetical protein
MTGAVIFVDESGDPGLKKAKIVAAKPYYVVGFVYVRQPPELRKRLRRFLKKAHQKGWYPRVLEELKFYLPKKWLYEHGCPYSEVDSKFLPHLDTVRNRALHIVADHCDGVFAAVLDKRKAEPTWTPGRVGNYVFAQSLVLDVLNTLQPSQCPTVIYDKGRVAGTNTAKFQEYLREKDAYVGRSGTKRYTGTIPTPTDVSSHMEPGIWAADLVAGAYYIRHQENDRRFSNILTKRWIGQGEYLYWT